MAGNPVASGNASLLGAALTPRTNYAARSAARQEAFQLAAYDATQQEQNALQYQQAQAQQEAYLQQLNSLPFMGRDVQKLQAHVKGEQDELYKRIRDDYQGDVKRWYGAEGSQWMNDAATRLKQSPIYQQGLQNVQNVQTAQEARRKGEFLVGSVGQGGYQTGEQQLADFLNGKSDSFTSGGSYKPEDDFKDIRSNVYAPGHMPWERVAMSEDEKVNHLIDTHGQSIGLDKYLRQHKGTSVFYKTDPLTKMYDFQRDQGRYAMAVDDQNMQHQRLGMEKTRLGIAISDHNQNFQLRAAQLQGVKLSNQKKANELNGTDASGLPFDYDLLAHPSVALRLKHDAGAPKKLSNGVDLGKVNALAGVTLFDGADEALARQLGLQKNGKDGYTGGNITSGFTTENGVHALNLRGSRFNVVNVAPQLFYNPGDVTPTGLNPNGVNGYARVTVQFASDAEASKTGLYNERWGWIPDSSTASGTGVYNPDTKQATIFVPTGNIDGRLNKGFMKSVQKNVMGQKARNESQSDADYPYTNTTF